MIRINYLAIAFIFFSPTSYAGTSTTYTNSGTLTAGAGSYVDVTLSNVTDTNGGTLTLWAFDIDNPGSATKTEEVTVQISYDGGTTFSSYLEWDYYQISVQTYSFFNTDANFYEDKGTLATYGSPIYDASATASDIDSNDGIGVNCQGSKACLIGDDIKYSRIVFTIPDFTTGKGFTSGDDLIIRVAMQNSDYAGFIVDHLTLEVFTNTLPTSNDFIVSTTPTYYTFSLSDFSFSDADSGTDGDQLEAIKITSSPASGELEYYNGSSWVDAVQNQEITRAELSANRLRASADFTFKVSDGYAFSSSSYTVTVSGDTTAPTFTFNPADTTTGVAVNSNITITASEAIRLLDNTALDDSNVDALITLKDTDASGSYIAFDATISGNVITINPTADFSSLQQIYVAINGTAVEDTADNAGALATATFTTADTSAPTLTSSNPADNATGVAVGSNIVLTFSENIQAGTGNIVISDGSGDTRTIAIGDAQITISGATLTINPTADLNSLTTYYVQIDATAVDDLAGNSYAGIADTTTLNFTTADATAPTLTSSNPADDATGVAVGSNIVLTFSEAVDTETGVITIKRVSDGSTVESFDVASSSAISGSGTTTITINPTSDLASSTAYYVEIASSAFDDAAGNSYAGISGATTLNFTTADIVAPAITGPSGGAGAATSAITVNENQTAVTQFTANETISSWTLSGDDAAKFAIAADGTLTFVAAPDFENPTDVGDTAANNTYVVIITATDSSSNASSQTLTVTVANVEDTPAEAFAANAQTIRQIVTDEANRSLRNTVSANRNMVQSARDRFADDMRQNAACGRDDQTDEEDRAYRDLQEVCTETVSTRNYIPFDVDGAFSLSGATLSTNGTFFGQSGSADGTWRRLFFGDFNVQRDGNTGSNTATLSARVAWEQMVSETTMLGYFIGAELGDSDIKGSFTGDQSRVALTLGGYAVHQLAEQVYLDGFLTLGAGRNDLSMANSVLSLDSDYSTRTATLGAAVSGIYAYEAYEFHPELSLSYGRTWLGNVGFTGRAYGVVDNTLSLDAGHVSVANLIFRPEVIWGLDGETVAGSNSQLSFAPRMICEQTRALRSTNDCGGGAELGLSTQSDDGLTNADFRVLMDRIGSSDRTSYAINLEHRF